MRLIDVEAFLDFDEGNVRSDARLLVELNGPKLVGTAYAILSHCWGEPEDEVQYMEMESLTKTGITTRSKVQRRSGYRKIRGSCLQARHDDLHWLWVDTCCIDKRSSAELSEAINSMYVWYANSDRCYAFLHDVDTETLPTKPDNKTFAEFNGWPKWFSRGWTLQELIAPENVHFFNRSWEYITNKQDSARKLNDITGISMDVLQKGLTFSYPSVAQMMSWAADRTTTREEDRAYSLLGLFGVHMPMLYGEGKHAFLRLQLEVIRMINDQSIFAWGWRKETGSASGFLANDPRDFRDCSNTVPGILAGLRWLRIE
ncbi:heterokaryon incompatibility protein-domain-containing protein [Pisolithus marmoratus]|nr:heterokaryon incompatibility protein-domain-containing protein [Pisolithus marmoratus]